MGPHSRTHLLGHSLDPSGHRDAALVVGGLIPGPEPAGAGGCRGADLPRRDGLLTVARQGTGRASLQIGETTVRSARLSGTRSPTTTRVAASGPNEAQTVAAEVDVTSNVRIPRAKASSSRSTVELLTLPWPFSQLQLLTAEEFVKETDKQGVAPKSWRFDDRALEDHRAGVLVPFYRVRLEDPDPDQRLDLRESLTLRHVPSSVTNELFRAAIDGRVTDPGEETFAPWPREHRRYPWPTKDWEFLYSHHQLHGLRRASALVAQLESSVVPHEPVTWELPTSALPSPEELQ